LKTGSKYEWKRLTEIYKAGEINVLKEPAEIREDPDILTEDVIQGELGDCYFLSAISALAEYPERIKQIFPELNLNRNGLFQLTGYIHGVPTNIVLDDHFPVIVDKVDKKGKPVFAFASYNARTKNIWPMLLEKAWAKVNLNYENIISGNSAEAFEFLCPAPVDTFYHDAHADTLYEEILDADRKDYIICTDITVTENTNLQNLGQMGLITNHAYTIVDAEEIFGPDGKKIRLLKMRNPWGTNEWTGDWSDDSPKWTPELKKLLNHTSELDGTFWMDYNDFLKFYTTTHICRYHNNYNYISQKFNFEKENAFSLINIKVSKNSAGFFILNQKNQRIYKNAKNLDSFQNRYCSMIVFRKDEKGFTYIGATSGRENRLYVECQSLLKGEYFVAVSFPNHSDDNVSDISALTEHSQKIQEETFTYSLGVYSYLDELFLDKYEGKDDTLREFIKYVMFDAASKNPEKYFFTDEGEPTSWRSISFEKEAGAYGYIVYNNNSDCYINEELNITQYLNINLIPIVDKKNIDVLEVDEIVEDLNERRALNFLKNKADTESVVKVTRAIPTSQVVSESNPIQILVRIAPHSNCIILVEKYEEDAAIEMSSSIALTYPTYALINEKKFLPKKNRVKYNNKLVEIYECVVEHNSGVLFKYKNKTNDLKFNAHVIFDDMENLKISLKPESILEDEESGDAVESYSYYDPSRSPYKIGNPDKEVVIVLEPGETKIFELTAIDYFDSFNYGCHMNYNINLSKNVIKQKYGMK
jgi:hypothetical protein